MQILFQTRRMQSLIWDLQRFGLTPGKLLARYFNKSVPRIVLISIPKSGTHLVERVLCLHPRLYRPLIPTLNPNNIERFGGVDTVLRKLKPGGVLVTHLHYSSEAASQLKSAGVKTIFVIRDPRDIVVSRAFYVARNKKHHYYPYVRDLSLNQRLLRSIIGDHERNYPSIAQSLAWFAEWLQEDGVFVVHFEDLIRSHESRQQVVQNLFDWLGITVDEPLLRYICRKSVSSASPTFRKGETGEWRKFLTGELYTLFMEKAGKWMEWYGYQ